MPSGFHTWSQTASSNASSDSAINWAEGQAPSSVNDSARAEMSVLAKWRDDNNGTLTTGGTSTALTLTSNTGFTTLALMDGQTIAFTMNATSGAAPTLNVDSLGAKPLRFASGVIPPTAAFLSGSVYHAKYGNSVGEFLVFNQSGVIPTNSVVTASITDANVTLAKIVNTSASRLLGNPTGSPAAPSEISLGSGLSFSGSTLKAATTPFTIQRFTSGTAQTYTTPANCTAIRIRMVGGGSGGGGGNNSAAATAGTASTFSGGTLSAGGGAGTASAVSGGAAGGAASGGNIANIAGGTGGPASGVTGVATGNGGNSFFGGAGGAGLPNSGSASAAATNSGSGGGGGAGGAASFAAAGGGAGGYVEHVISTPASTYTYTVGSGGAGASGTSAGNGGAGGAGLIIVEEYY